MHIVKTEESQEKYFEISLKGVINVKCYSANMYDSQRSSRVLLEFVPWKSHYQLLKSCMFSNA